MRKQRAACLPQTVFALLLAASCKPQEAPKPKAPEAKAPLATSTPTPATATASAPASAPVSAPAIATIASKDIAFTDLSMTDPSHGWATSDAKLYLTSDGARWSPVTMPKLPTDAAFGAVFVLDPMNLWLNASSTENQAGADLIWHTHDGGKTWESASLEIKELLDEGATAVSLDFVDASHGWANVTSSPGMNQHHGWLFSTSDGGKSWKRVNTEAAVDRLSFQDAMHGLMVSVSAPTVPPQNLMATSDGGVTWKSIALPLPGKHSADDLNNFLAIQLPNAKSPKEGNLMAQANDEIFVYHTSDGGLTWTVSPAGPTLEYPTTDFSPNGVAWILSASEAGLSVQISLDHGATWSMNPTSGLDIGTVTRLAVTGEKTAAAIESEALLLTTDSGKSWNKVE